VKASAAALQSGKGKRWAKRLRGDLDNILRMALRSEPERRYLTVEQMQADLRKHLAGLPVSARRETWWYRCGKFFRRHPIGAPAAAAIAIAAVVGVIVIARAEADAQRQRRKAEQRMDQLVELANRALINVHGSIERLPGATQARLEMVKSTLEYLDRLSAESGNDARVLSALASAYTSMATVQGSPLQPNLGDLRGAEESYVKAGKILDSLIVSGADNSEVRLRDAELREVYGLLLSETGRKDEAMAQYRRGLDQLRMVLTREPRNLEARKDNSRIHLAMGQITKYDDPEGTRRRDLELLPLDEALVAEYPRDTDCLLDLAFFWSQIGSTFEEESQLPGAADAFRRSAGLREQVYSMRPQDVTVQHDLLIAYGHLGDITGSPMFPSLGNYREGVGWYRKALAIAQQMVAADRSNVQARNDEGTALLRIGASQTAAGEHRAALESLQRAEDFLMPLHNASPASQTLAERVGLIYLYRSRALAAMDDHVAEIEAVRRSLDICQTILRDHASPTCRHTVWVSQDYLALALVSSGDADAGLRKSEEVLESVTKAVGEPTLPVYRARALAANGAVHVALAKRASADGRVAEWRAAAESYRRALVEYRTYPGIGSEPFASEMRQAEAALFLSQRGLNDR
jgi:tetratricopeptide (TPR) repeat protein